MYESTSVIRGRIFGSGVWEALEKEFQVQEIPFKKQLKLELYYHNQKLNRLYRADFICYDSIILEIKAVQQIPIAFYSQLNNHLKCTKMEIGLLINFGYAFINL